MEFIAKSRDSIVAALSDVTPPAYFVGIMGEDQKWFYAKTVHGFWVMEAASEIVRFEARARHARDFQFFVYDNHPRPEPSARDMYFGFDESLYQLSDEEFVTFVTMAKLMGDMQWRAMFDGGAPLPFEVTS